jgi:hypothetical protein
MDCDGAASAFSQLEAQDPPPSTLFCSNARCAMACFPVTGFPIRELPSQPAGYDCQLPVRHEPTVIGRYHRLGTVTRTKLQQQAAQVRLDRLTAEEQTPACRSRRFSRSVRPADTDEVTGNPVSVLCVAPCSALLMGREDTELHALTDYQEATWNAG